MPLVKQSVSLIMEQNFGVYKIWMTVWMDGLVVHKVVPVVQKIWIFQKRQLCIVGFDHLFFYDLPDLIVRIKLKLGPMQVNTSRCIFWMVQIFTSKCMCKTWAHLTLSIRLILCNRSSNNNKIRLELTSIIIFVVTLVFVVVCIIGIYQQLLPFFTSPCYSHCLARGGSYQH